ncbi:alcohol dehydrogenase catalytic domain-containing protein [Gordonia humi]|uniref:Propanol-preferring alcohol dehydrogenase n=1 Tax=Gordonia humi TaxID=686429 RepID=A0A840EZI4_9ACTN|nr:alcohol dehydrogenase catalytic domain-containing protein [Gordonia humi]MBB4133550.1 propanol-preferring alcohol dehydrogenase [Gordonia humi]
MRALTYRGPGRVEWTEVPTPEPDAGQVRIEVTACGVCHTDVTFRESPTPALPVGLTMGHEIAGVVSALGVGVTSLSPGQPVVVHTVWACGTCRNCTAGRQNACLSTSGRLVSPHGPGTRFDGGMAEYVVVPASSVVAADGIAPALAAVLPDAGIVPYHSIRTSLSLLGPGSSATVIGIGGLGQFAVSILRATTATRIIAVDVRRQALAAVADEVDAAVDARDPDAIEQVLAHAGGHGPDVVLDFVGSTETLRMATSSVAPYGAIHVPGQAGGVFEFETVRTTASIPRGATIDRPYSGTRRDLVDVVALARNGLVGVDVTPYPFHRALDAYDDLHAGRIIGRAVVVR